MNRCSHHILVLLQLFACADCLRASPAAFRAISASHTSSRNAPRMAAGGSKRAREMAAKKAQARPGYVPEGRNLKNGLPEEVFARTNFATSGARDANTVKEIEMNWAAFKGCFANEKLAIEAAKKNSGATFLSLVSTPRLSSRMPLRLVSRALLRRTQPSSRLSSRGRRRSRARTRCSSSDWARLRPPSFS